MNNEDYGKVLRDFILTLDKFRKGKKESANGGVIVYDINNDEAILKLLSAMSEMYRYQIHEYLVPMETADSEKEIRGHIKDIICDILPIVEAKIRNITARIESIRRKPKSKSAEFANELKSLTDTRNRYLVLLDDYYALAAFRSLKHFALYSEFDKPDSQKVWKHAMNCFESFFFYANSMVLDGKIKRMSKSLPTGYGKSYSDIELIGFIFGVNINNDIMKTVGNNKLIVDIVSGVTRMMCSKWYSKVFPYYAQFEGNKDLMFDIGKASEGMLLIHGSQRPKSLLVTAKDTAIDGARAKFRLYDDITRSKDKENVAEHEKDWAKYTDQWSKRSYNEYDDYEIAGGTRYHTEDFLSRYREHWGEEEAVPDKKFKYTMINPRTKFVIISVPKLDPDTDESTYPQKFSTEKARLERNRDPRTFAAMEQQQPEAPENSPFYWDNLNLYETLPLKKCEGGEREDTNYVYVYISESNSPNRCFVERTPKNGLFESFESVQTITYENSFYPARFYWLVDRDANKLYIYGSSIPSASSNPSANYPRITEFDLPDRAEDITLTDDDAICTWGLRDTMGADLIECLQGADIIKHKLYLCDGSTITEHQSILVYDLNTHKYLSRIQTNANKYEPEGVAEYNGSLLCAHNVSNKGYVTQLSFDGQYIYANSTNKEPDINVVSKKITVFGDSIWARDGKNYPVADVPYNADTYGTLCRSYPTLIREKYGFTVTNKAVSGHKITDQLPIILAETFTDTDIVIISVGVNDYRQSELLGAIPTATGIEFDTTTYIGGLCKGIEHIKTQNPNTKIILVTPMQRDTKWKNNGVADISLAAADIYTKNNNNNILEDFRNAVIEVAKNYSCIVADMYAESGLNYLTMATHTSDGLHPVNAGYEFTAPCIFRAIEKTFD